MVSRRKQLKPVKRSVASINAECFINEDDSSDHEIFDDSNNTGNDYHLNLSPLERIIQQAASSSRIQPLQQMLMKCSSPSEYDDIKSISNLSPSSSSNIPSSSSPSSPLALLSYINSLPSTSSSNSFHISSDQLKNIGNYSDDSPLKCLERYVKPKQEFTYTSKKCSPNKSICHKSLQRNVSTNAASAPYILPSKKGSDRNANEEESNALCELSQLVHKVGSFRKTSCTHNNNNNNNSSNPIQKDNSCAQSVFTCLQCSLSYETLDELVFHISTTKHFTRITNKSIEPVAPWEKGLMTTGDNDKHRTRQKRLLECTLCGQKFNGDAEYHLRYKHKFDSFMDWISVIKIADTHSNPDKNSIELNKLQMIINGVKK